MVYETYAEELERTSLEAKRIFKMLNRQLKKEEKEDKK